jgi:transposase
MSANAWTSSPPSSSCTATFAASQGEGPLPLMWACRCCQILVQEPVELQIIDSGIPTAGLVARTLLNRFVDHLPYYRQEANNARSGVHTPSSTLTAWSGRGHTAIRPLT